jgi:hypothetical protein
MRSVEPQPTRRYSVVGSVMLVVWFLLGVALVATGNAFAAMIVTVAVLILSLALKRTGLLDRWSYHSAALARAEARRGRQSTLTPTQQMVRWGALLAFLLVMLWIATI